MSPVRAPWWPLRPPAEARHGAIWYACTRVPDAAWLTGGLGDLRLALSVAQGSDPSPSAGPRPGGDSGGSGGGATGVDEIDPRVQALVDLARRGDAEAFGQLYERYVDVVYRYAYLRTGTAQGAEDVTSETFLRAFRRIDTFTWQGRDLAAWLITIARNIVTDTAKSARFRLEVTTGDLLDTTTIGDRAGGTTPEDEAVRAGRDRRLVEAIRTLTSEQAECVVLRFLHGLSTAEVATILGRNENAVKQLQLRAVRALRRELGDEPI